MKTKKIIVGETYYFNKAVKKFKCTKVGKLLSFFVDYKNSEHQFYNEDIYIDKY